MEEYEFAAAKAEVERFFWTDLCDNYLELVKFRLYGDADGAQADEASREGARYTLYNAVLAVLKMLAPFMPHITEEVYVAGFATTDGAKSVHLAAWPTGDAAWEDASAAATGAQLVEVVDSVRRWKADRKQSVGAPVAVVRVAGPADLVAALEGVRLDLRSVTRAQSIELSTSGDGAVEVSVEPLLAPAS